MIRKLSPLLLAGLFVPFAVAQGQTREPLRCVDPQGKTTLLESEVHHLSEAGVVQPVLIHPVAAESGGKTIAPSHTLLYEALVDQDGRVCAVRSLVGIETPETRSCLEAIRQWRYQPATLHGQPISFFTIESIKPAEEDRPVQAAPPPPQPLPRSTAEVVIAPHQLTIANHTISLPASHQQLASALGAPTRADETPGSPTRVAIWDSLGLVVYESRATGKISGLSFYLQSIPDRSISPSALAGSMTIGDMKIDAGSKLDAVGHEIIRQGGKHVHRLAFGVWTLSYGSFDITLEEIDSPTLQTVSLNMKP